MGSLRKKSKKKKRKPKDIARSSGDSDGQVSGEELEASVSQNDTAVTENHAEAAEEQAGAEGKKNEKVDAQVH